jgi:hypothetical protein
VVSGRLVEDGQAIDVLDLQDRAAKASLVPCRGGALLALNCISVDVVAREAVFGGNKVGRDALRHEIMRNRDRWIDRPGTARCADADPAHRFDAATDRHVLLSRHDLRRSKIHRVETGSAEAVDLHARDTVAITGDQRRGAGDVGAGFADRIDDPHDHVIDQRRIKLVAVLDGAKRLAGEIERGHFVQRAVHFAAAAGCSHVIINKSVGHSVSS